MRKLYFFVFTAITLTFTTNASWAKLKYINRIPNSVKNGCGNCHIDMYNGGELNPFGRAIQSHFIEDDNVQWQTALATLDSDNDGVTNGEELQDPTGAWRVDDPPPGNISLVTNPGVVDNFPGPTLLSPSDKYIGAPFKVQLKWGNILGAASYRVEVSDDINFSSTVFVGDTVKATTITTNELLPNKEYYWRAKAQVSDAICHWSSIFSFKTRLAVPKPISPVQNASGIGIPPTFNWNVVEGAVYYFLEISTTTDFSKPVVSIHDLTDTTVTILDLSVNKIYYWRIMADDSPQHSDWSSTMVFDTKTPGPVPVAPLNGAVGLEPSVAFLWNRLENISLYNVQIDTNNSFSEPLISRNGIQDTTITIEGLEYGRIYYWRVNGEAGTDAGQWSEIRSFKVKPPAPTLIDPLVQFAGADTAVTFLWTKVPEVTGYRLEVSSTNEFTEPVKITEHIADTTAKVGGLSFDSQYFWRAAAQDPSTGAYTEIRSFKTGIEPPVLFSPESNSVDVNLSTNFSWTYGAGDYKFEIQISKDLSFPEPSRLVEVNAYDTTGLEPLTEYYWRVRAVANDKLGVWSQPWTFTTANNGSAYDSQTITAKLSPNPTSGRLIAEMEFIRPGNLRIYVVDITGKICLDLGAKGYNSGAELIEFDVKSLAPGSYRLVFDGGPDKSALPFVKAE